MENVMDVTVLDKTEYEQAEMEVALKEAVTDLEFQAESIIIDCEADYQNAAEFGRMLKRRTAQVKDFWKPMKDAAHKAHAEICDKEKAMLKPLTNAEKILKQTMGSYIAEQERKRREAEEAARRAAREEAERQMAKAIALEEQGNQEAAEAAVDEAQIMDETADSISVPQQKPKAEGVYGKKDWKITCIDSSKVPISVSGAEIRPVDTAAVMRLIRATKGQIQIPGIVFEETVQVSFRR